jgi:2-(1,2-epoxy-1,2-dihydrophenyl)acetyl-CoA isomerase
MKRMEIPTGTTMVRAWRDDGVGVVELNRPERRNALHPEMYAAVPQVLEKMDEDDSVRCIVVTAAGPTFCAGGDVRDGAPPLSLDEMARMVVKLYGSPKITIAALPGPAVGAGIGIALAADLRIAAASAALVTGWAGLAFSGDFGGTWFLTRMIGPARALELLIGNGRIESADALRLGIFNKVVADGELRAEAMAWARAISDGPQVAFRFMKANVRDAERMDLVEALPRESERMRRSGQTDEHREAVRRWLERSRQRSGVAGTRHDGRTP